MSEDDWQAPVSGAKESLEARLAAFLSREAEWDPEDVAEVLGEAELGPDADASTLAELRGLADSFEYHGTMAQGELASSDSSEVLGGFDIESALREHLPRRTSVGSVDAASPGPGGPGVDEHSVDEHSVDEQGASGHSVDEHGASGHRASRHGVPSTVDRGRRWQVFAAAAGVAALLGAGFWAMRTPEPDFSRHSGVLGDSSAGGSVTLQRPPNERPRLVVDLPKTHARHLGELRAEVKRLGADKEWSTVFEGELEGTTHVFSAADAAALEGPLRWRAWIELIGDAEPRWEAHGESSP